MCRCAASSVCADEEGSLPCDAEESSDPAVRAAVHVRVFFATIICPLVFGSEWLEFEDIVSCSNN